MSSKFFTNNNERNMFDKFKGIIKHMKDLYAFYAVSSTVEISSTLTTRFRKKQGQ